jgi:hypothetical protein
MKGRFALIDGKILSEIVKNSKSLTEVAQTLEYKASGGIFKFLKRKLREFNIDTSHFKHRKYTRLMKNINDEEFKHLFRDSKSLAEIGRKIGCAPAGSLYRFLNSKKEQLKINTDHFSGKVWSKGLTRDTDARVEEQSKKIELPWNEVFKKDSNISNRNLLKRLLRSGKRKYLCEICGISEWQGKFIRLQIHHKNGINDDNREKNLEIDCPNCHSQKENQNKTKVR